MWKTIAKYLVLIALLTYTAIAVVWANRQAAYQKCTGLEISIEETPGSPHKFVTKDGVLSELGPLATDYTKMRVKDVNITSLERQLQRNNNYEHVECAMLPGGRLKISILPMIPEARVVTRNGVGYYINRDGKRIDARPVFHTDVPVIAGKFTSRFPASSLLPVVRYLKHDTVWGNLVSMVYANDADNIYVVPRIRGHVICLGDTSRLPEKFRNMMLMYRRVMPYKGWNTYDTISVKYKGQIVATRSNKTAVHVAETIDEDEQADENSLQAANPEAARTETSAPQTANKKEDVKKEDKPEKKTPKKNSKANNKAKKDKQV